MRHTSLLYRAGFVVAWVLLTALLFPGHKTAAFSEPPIMALYYTSCGMGNCTEGQPGHPAPLSQTPPPSLTYFPESGHFLGGAFRYYWEQHGGVGRFGYPVTEEYLRSGDGKLVQYFERARFELRMEGDQALVDLGLIGRDYLDYYQLAFERVSPVEPTDDLAYFPETGHTLRGLLKEYWEEQGGLAFFGYPLSEEVTAKFPDGTDRTVQYFERARMELHGNTVMVGTLGRALAPCHLTQYRLADQPPPQHEHLTEGDPEPCPPSLAVHIDQPHAGMATGHVYYAAARPGEVQGFEAWNFVPDELVSLWLNLPDGSTRPLPYKAIANRRGYVLVGFQTRESDPTGPWSLVAEGNSSGRRVVAPFELRW